MVAGAALVPDDGDRVPLCEPGAGDRQLGHLTHDAVPMPRAIGQRGEHKEGLPRHGPASHPANILETKILVHIQHRNLTGLAPQFCVGAEAEPARHCQHLVLVSS